MVQSSATTESGESGESGAPGAPPIPPVSHPSVTDEFLAAGLPDDILTLSDAPFSGGLLLPHPAVLAMKEMGRIRQINAHALSDPPTRSQLVAYVRETESLFSQLEAANRKVSGGGASSSSGGSATGASAGTSSGSSAGANAPSTIPPRPSSFSQLTSTVSTNGQSAPFPVKPKMITLDDLVPFRGVSYAKETMPEPYRAMLEKRMYLPLPALTHKNVHDLRTGTKRDEMAKIGDDKDPEAKLIRRPVMDPYLVVEFAISKTELVEAYQLLILAMKESPTLGGAVATMFESWFSKLQEHTNWYNPRLWPALVRFDHKWRHRWFVDPNLTRLDESMFEDMHEHVAFVNERNSLEAEQRRDESVALVLRDLSHGRSTHNQNSYRRRGDRSVSPPRSGPRDYARQPRFPNSKLPFPGGSQGSSSSPVCIVCGATGHKAVACRATTTSLGKQTVTVMHNQKLVTVTDRSLICFTFNISSCTRIGAGHTSSEHRCSLCLSSHHGARSCTGH